MKRRDPFSVFLHDYLYGRFYANKLPQLPCNYTWILDSYTNVFIIYYKDFLVQGYITVEQARLLSKAELACRTGAILAEFMKTAKYRDYLSVL